MATKVLTIAGIFVGVLRKQALSLATACLLLGPLAAPPAAAQRFDAQSGTMSLSIAHLTDQYRQSQKSEKIGPVRWNVLFMRVARTYAELLAEKNLTGHVADGRDPVKRVEDAKIRHCGVWENVAEYASWPNKADWQVARDFAMNFWKNSKGHNENLLRPGVTVVSAAAAGWKHDGKYYYKIVQLIANDCQPVDRPVKRLVPRRDR